MLGGWGPKQNKARSLGVQDEKEGCKVSHGQMFERLGHKYFLEDMIEQGLRVHATKQAPPTKEQDSHDGATNASVGTVGAPSLQEGGGVVAAYEGVTRGRMQRGRWLALANSHCSRWNCLGALANYSKGHQSQCKGSAWPNQVQHASGEGHFVLTGGGLTCGSSCKREGGCEMWVARVFRQLCIEVCAKNPGKREL